MMKRQFLRVKQIAEETFQKGEKTEVLTDELTAAEKRVDGIRQSCQTTTKKLSTCLHRLTTDASLSAPSFSASSSDRRHSKRVPEAALAHCMEEYGLQLGESSILGLTLVDCARMQDALACDLLTYKMEAEDLVVQPLQNLLKVEIASITKCRKQLAKLTAEMDSAKTKYQVAFKNCQQVSGNNLAAAVAKAELLKEEFEDCSTKVDQCRDTLASEMFSLISREPELAQLYVKLCQLQLEYHRAALSVLESNLTEVETQINSCPHHPVFGVALEDHLHYTNREIASVIETCICCLKEIAMNEEGLFRIGGSITKIKKMKSVFDAGLTHLIEQERDPHNLAGVLKLYLRSLPEPLLTHSLYEDWMAAARIRDHSSQLQALWTTVNSLPEANFKNLRYLVKFLSSLCQNSEVNKMSYQNVAIVMGPNLLWPPVEDETLGMNMTATNIHSSIVDSLITYADYFFPGECDFYVSNSSSPRQLDCGSLADSQLSLSTTKLSNGDSAVDSLSSSPTNSPKSPSPRVVPRPKKKVAPLAPPEDRFLIQRSLSCGIFRENGQIAGARFPSLSASQENLLIATQQMRNGSEDNKDSRPLAATNNVPVESQQPVPVEANKNSAVPDPVKPVRAKHKTLSTVVEKVPRKQRPSVPPPERPESCEVPLVDITVSSSDYKTMSFMDDSDLEEEKVPADPVPVQTIHRNGSLRRVEKSPPRSFSESKEETLEDNVFESNASPNVPRRSEQQFRTVIPVDGDTGDGATVVQEGQDEYKPLYKFSPPKDTSIKLRVNSDSQNTRL